MEERRLERHVLRGVERFESERERPRALGDQLGRYRRYFLRVPPTTRTARAAVAWTFGFDAVGDYAVAVQS